MTRVAIIGGGLAGTACACALKNTGAQPVIYEASAELASGASGNRLGLYNPRLAAEKTPESEYFISAFNRALEAFECLSDVDWNPCGALHLITDEKRETRYNKMVKNWGWSEDEMRIVSPQETSEIAGVQIDHEALYLSRSGYISPQKLCSALAKDVEVHLDTKIVSLDDLEADAVIIASGMASQVFVPDLELRAVRGQITYAKATKQSENLKAAICYGGYCAPALDGQHIVGSSFSAGWITPISLSKMIMIIYKSLLLMFLHWRMGWKLKGRGLLYAPHLKITFR